MRLKLKRDLDLFFQKIWNKLSLILFLCFLHCFFISKAESTFVTLQFAHPITQKSLNLDKELKKYWKMFDDKVFVWWCAILPYLSDYLQFKTTLYMYIHNKIWLYCPSWTKWNNMHFQMEKIFWFEIKYINWFHTKHSKSQPLIFYICHNLCHDKR
jgi:hypothetical protein